MQYHNKTFVISFTAQEFGLGFHKYPNWFLAYWNSIFNGLDLLQEALHIIWKGDKFEQIKILPHLSQ